MTNPTGEIDSIGDYYHYQFYVRVSGNYIAFGVPVIHDGRMTLDELRHAGDVAKSVLQPNDPFRAMPLYFTECPVIIQTLDGKVIS